MELQPYYEDYLAKNGVLLNLDVDSLIITETGGRDDMSNEIARLKATNGTIVAYDDRVVIERKGFGAFVTQGVKGDRTFFYSELSGVEYRKPGMLNGYMKFITPGTQSTSAKTGLFGSSMQSAEDENTVILRAFNRSVPAQSEELYNIILERINNSKYSNTNSSASSVSSADEILKYKKLLDEGIITQEEFDAKKKQLLGL